MEIECYADSKSHVVGGVTNDQLIGGAGTSPVTADVVKKLTERMERLEARLEGERERTGDGRRPNRSNDRPLTCWNCGGPGHVARYCRAQRKRQGNDSPSMA